MSLFSNLEAWSRASAKSVAEVNRLSDGSTAFALTFIAGAALLLQSPLKVPSEALLVLSLYLLIASAITGLIVVRSLLLWHALSLKGLRGRNDSPQMVWSYIARLTTILLFAAGAGVFFIVLIWSIQITDLNPST